MVQVRCHSLWLPRQSPAPRALDCNNLVKLEWRLWNPIKYPDGAGIELCNGAMQIPRIYTYVRIACFFFFVFFVSFDVETIPQPIP